MQTNINLETVKIRKMNDHLRKYGVGGQIMVTRGILSLEKPVQAQIVSAVRDFNQFTPDNDPYGEHDFGQVIVCGIKAFWKIDYYDQNLRYGSDDPSNPQITKRVLTIMLAEEY